MMSDHLQVLLKAGVNGSENKGEIIPILYCVFQLKDFYPCLKETCFIHLPGDYR